MEFLEILGLFIVTALAEIVGCLPSYLWLKQGRPVWLWAVDAARPTATDFVGAAICVDGMGVIMLGPRYA